MPAARALALDCDLSFTTGGDGGATWGTEDWMPYYGPDMAAGGNIGADEQVWMQTSVSVSDGEKMSFYWKVSSESSADYLKFYINNVLQHQISGNVDWQKKSYTFSGSGTKTLKWTYVKDSQNSAGQDKGWVDGLVIGSGSLIPQPDAMSEALDCDLKFTSSGSTEGDLWYAYSGPVVKYYLNGDSARTDETLTHNREACLQTIVESDSAETVKFYWKVSSEQDYDYLQFYIDSTLKDQISGEVDWQQKSYSVAAGTHTLKWRYIKNGSVSSGENRAWVDFVQWTGPSPAKNPSNWQEIAYKHDVGGRRVEKKVDGYSTRYLYDGPHVIAEYDGNNNLLRKYIYGPGIDQPVCMIEVADANATYYYHYDALGSVVALSDSSGDTVQTYEYSVYGEVAVEDANHPNPYMFAGVRYDIEIGLYYNRARYYNPFTGRFLQTDPIGYGGGMNWYAYCGNNSLNRVDPSGLYERSVDIPLEMIWHRSSVGAKIGNRTVTEGDDPQHQSDVQGFLNESNFSKEFPDVTLKSVTYSGNETAGSYLVVFEVPDKYDSMRIEKEEQAGGVEILVVKTGHWYKRSTKKVEIWDWRLLGMVGESLARAEVDSASRYWADAWIKGIATAIAGGVLIEAPETWPVSGPIFAILFGWTVYDAYKVYTSPEVFPNYIIPKNYLEYVGAEAEDVVSKYEDYKRRRNLGLI